MNMKTAALWKNELVSIDLLHNSLLNNNYCHASCSTHMASLINLKSAHKSNYFKNGCVDFCCGVGCSSTAAGGGAEGVDSDSDMG